MNKPKPPERIVVEQALARATSSLDLSTLTRIEPWLGLVPVKIRFEAFAQMCKQGWISGAKILHPHVNPARANSAPLMEAAAEGKQVTVNWLIPLSQPSVNQSQALRAAMRAGHDKVVSCLLPFATPSDISLGVADALKSLDQSHVLMHSPSYKNAAAARIEGITRSIVLCLPLADFKKIVDTCLPRQRPGQIAKLDEGMFACVQAASVSIESLGSADDWVKWRDQFPRLHTCWQAHCIAQATPVSTDPAQSRVRF